MESHPLLDNSPVILVKWFFLPNAKWNSYVHIHIYIYIYTCIHIPSLWIPHLFIPKIHPQPTPDTCRLRTHEAHSHIVTQQLQGIPAVWPTRNSGSLAKKWMRLHSGYQVLGRCIYVYIFVNIYVHVCVYIYIYAIAYIHGTIVTMVDKPTLIHTCQLASMDWLKQWKWMFNHQNWENNIQIVT